MSPYLPMIIREIQRHISRKQATQEMTVGRLARPCLPAGSVISRQTPYPSRSQPRGGASIAIPTWRAYGFLCSAIMTNAYRTH